MATVIEWLATQPWSLGTVGMYGYSYSGFNSIQVAMERPPALKAIIPIYATDDRFGDDVHFQGGVVKQLDQIDYPSYMVASNALPPAPPIYGEDMARGVGAPPRRHGAVGAHVARAPAPRRLLETRVALRRLRGDRGAPR